MGLADAVTSAEAWWADHGYRVVIAALIATTVTLVATLIAARRRGRVDRWVSTVAGIAVLGLSAEGMWMVAVDRLHLPAVLALVTFAVFELAMVSSAIHATAQYRRTTVRDETGAIVTPGHPGRHGTVVWAIAATAGVIVSLNSQSFVEVLLRLTLPVLAAGMWWTGLTAEGTSRPEGTWRWTPRRLLVRIGAIEPNERDLADVTRERRVAAMTSTARRVHRGSRPRSWHTARLERFALTADDVTMREVQSRVERAHRARELTAPGQTTTGHTRESETPSGSRLVGPERVPNGRRSGKPVVVGRLATLSGQSTSTTATEPVRQAQKAGSRSARRSHPDDDAILATHGESLVAELVETGRLTEYRIRQVTGVTARPSRRIKDRVEALANERHQPGHDHQDHDETTPPEHEEHTSTGIQEAETDTIHATRHDHETQPA